MHLETVCNLALRWVLNPHQGAGIAVIVVAVVGSLLVVIILLVALLAPSKSYELGHSSQIAGEAKSMMEFYGGSSASYYCRDQIDRWSRAHDKPSWLDRDDALRGCLDALK